MKLRNYLVSELIEKPNEDPIYIPHRIWAAYMQVYQGMLRFYDEKDNLIKDFEINDDLHFEYPINFKSLIR
tara:strand:+ start:240 stop:452 length:213 start_codon:yes stop_codon:yes gene_type:complete